MLNKNPNAIHILFNNPTKINWSHFSQNANAM